jgi:RimJ/RimL family protein N-acetyltransferase
MDARSCDGLWRRLFCLRVNRERTDGEMQVFLETERLLLRRFTEDDVDNLCELDGDPAVMRFINGGAPTPREVIQNETLPRFLSYYERFAGFGFWAAIEKSSGEFLGWFHFRSPEGSPPDEIELGYRLRTSAWGKGYATEGSRALIRKGFIEQGVRRVVASTYQDNIGSQRVMQKSGLTLVRTFRMTPAELAAHGLDPEVRWDGDDVEYALKKADWERQEAARADGKESRTP